MRLSVVSSAVAVSVAAALLTPAAAFAATGLDPVRLQGARATGTLHGALSATVALAPRHKAGLAKAAARGRGLTPAAFKRRYAPSRATVRAVRRWAKRHSLRVSSVSANRTLVRLRGSSAAVGRAFGTRLETFSAGGASFYAPATRARLPRVLKGRTTAVLGLSNLGRVGFSPRPRAASGLNFPASYGPRDLAALYGAAPSATGAGQQVSVIAEGDLTQPRADLATFEDHFGLPHVTWNQIQVGAPSADTSGSDEFDLDTQYSTGMAPGVAQVNVYDAPSLSDADILAAINRWVTDDATAQASFSAGECEILAFAAGFTGALDVALEQAAAQGQSLFVSSGDTGVFCSAVVGVNGVPAGIPNVEYPASSPYAVGVGGTTVLGPGPTEIGWYAGGGGSSFFEPVPAYQSSAGGSFLGLGRGVPDVALDADPNSGYVVIVGGQPETIGGTSAGAPSWQGIWARVQAARGPLGFADPVLYGEPASAFNDITLGANGAPNTPGWDYVTGRGTPKVSALVGG